MANISLQAGELIDEKLQELLPGYLAPVRDHILSKCMAKVDEKLIALPRGGCGRSVLATIAESLAASECAAEKELVDPLVKQHVQLQCLSKTTLNGSIAFVMDRKPEGRYAVYAPATKQRLSIQGDKLRLLSAAEAADYFDNPRYWKQGYHARVKHELNTYEAEKHASQGIPLKEDEKTAIGINEARKQLSDQGAKNDILQHFMGMNDREMDSFLNDDGVEDFFKGRAGSSAFFR